MKNQLTILLLISLFYSVNGQKRLLDNEYILDDVNKCITSTYNYNFEEAKKALTVVENYTTDHPAVLFLKAFIIYWEHFPIVPGHPKEEAFLTYIEDCIISSEQWVQRSENELEAVFFDLFSRAFYSMYWSDNGKPAKVFPHLNTLYRQTLKGFEMKEKFNEFFFTTGLYNYYIQAYPEKHPAFKPVVTVFQEGNKTLGLKQLEYCAENAIFLRAEAVFFLAHIHLSYEMDFKKASEYAAKLYREFPKNSFYAGKYLEILLFNEKYFLAPVILGHLKKWNDPFSRMQYHLYKAYYLEKVDKKLAEAHEEYLRALELSEPFGKFSGTYSAIAYMGIGRYYQKNENKSLANRYFRKAKKETVYEYIYNDR